MSQFTLPAYVCLTTADLLLLFVCLSIIPRRRTIQDASRQRLTWSKPPLSVLVIKKIQDRSVIAPFLELIRWLIWVHRTINAHTHC